MHDSAAVLEKLMDETASTDVHLSPWLPSSAGNTNAMVQWLQACRAHVSPILSTLDLTPHGPPLEQLKLASSACGALAAIATRFTAGDLALNEADKAVGERAVYRLEAVARAHAAVAALQGAVHQVLADVGERRGQLACDANAEARASSAMARVAATATAIVPAVKALHERWVNESASGEAARKAAVAEAKVASLEQALLLSDFAKHKGRRTELARTSQEAARWKGEHAGEWAEFEKLTSRCRERARHVLSRYNHLHLQSFPHIPIVGCRPMHCRVRGYFGARIEQKQVH